MLVHDSPHPPKKASQPAGATHPVAEAVVVHEKHRIQQLHKVVGGAGLGHAAAVLVQQVQQVGAINQLPLRGKGWQGGAVSARPASNAAHRDRHRDRRLPIAALPRPIAALTTITSCVFFSANTSSSLTMFSWATLLDRVTCGGVGGGWTAGWPVGLLVGACAALAVRGGCRCPPSAYPPPA